MSIPLNHLDDDGTGVEIRPGVVIVNIPITNARAMTVEELAEAMLEAEAQEDELNLGAEELLGDLDINPL